MFITGKYPPEKCGVGDYTHRLAEKLIECGHEVVILTSAPKEKPQTIAEGQGDAEVVRRINKWDFKGLPSVLNSVLEKEVDLVNIQFNISAFDWHPMVTLLPYLIKRHMKKVKIVVTLHELAAPTTAFRLGPLRRIWLLPLLFWSDAVIATNEGDASMLSRVPFLKGKLRYIWLAPNIDVDQDLDRQAIRKQLCVAEDEILVARFGFVHNIRISFIPQLLQAIKRLRDKGYRVALLLVGEVNPKDAAIVRSLAKSQGITEHVLLTGYCPNRMVSQYLGSADIAVQLYPDDVSGSRGALLAAMSHGLPVIGLQKGHAHSIYINYKNILFISKCKPKQIMQGIEKLILDKALRDTLRENAAHLAKKFNWETVCQHSCELYRTLVENN